MTSARQWNIFGILPPHILEAIAKNAEGKQKDWALRMLGIDHSMRTIRMAKHFSRAITRIVPEPVATPYKYRAVYTAKNTTTQPGTLVRSEAQPASGDKAVDEAYDGLGATFDLYWNVYKRNSIDNAGMNLIATVHYDKDYDNAFWDGSQMVFGDGDATFFNRFTIAVDVIGHELTHGVTAHQANLSYHDQPGALNESVSDVFGSLVKQYVHSPQQTAAQADWLIGAGLFTSKVNGVALRSMKAPGTAYDDRMLGKDPQPATMSNYVHTTQDQGGVHINSGIPNHAFYLLAIALGGFAWEKAGAIWYATICDPRLSTEAQFLDFANLTADNALKLFTPAEQQAVVNAWQQVGINVIPITTKKIFGNWTLHYSWGATGTYNSVKLTFNNNGTFSGGATGRWSQQDGTVLLSFDSGPAKYAGTIDGNIGTGAMSTFTGSDGCWYLSKEGTIGAAPELGVTGRSEMDVSGNPVAPEMELVGVGPQGVSQKRSRK